MIRIKTNELENDLTQIISNVGGKKSSSNVHSATSRSSLVSSYCHWDLQPFNESDNNKLNALEESLIPTNDVQSKLTVTKLPPQPQPLKLTRSDEFLKSSSSSFGQSKSNSATITSMQDLQHNHQQGSHSSIQPNPIKHSAMKQLVHQQKSKVVAESSSSNLTSKPVPYNTLSMSSSSSSPSSYKYTPLRQSWTNLTHKSKQISSLSSSSSYSNSSLSDNRQNQM
jgi:hypothetical protein